MKSHEYFALLCYSKERYWYSEYMRQYIFQVLPRDRTGRITPVGEIYVLDPWAIAVNGRNMLLSEHVVVVSENEAGEYLDLINRLNNEDVGISGS